MAPYPSHSSSLHDRVKCMVRTRVPTPYGDVFIHLYHNARDNKEHLAIVVDPAQLRSNDASRPHAQYIRSRSLDAAWSEDETAMDRISRGAYVGRLSEHSLQPSKPFDSKREALQLSPALVPPPLVRIHSECFTGETIGSMRCDCGEQLDNALCRMAQPITIRDPISGARITIPGRGVIVYMRQEGRGIGLLSKLRAYNLQDLGHDTVQANLMLGYGIDEREYSTAAAILQDLGLDSAQGVRLLTNNPDKIEKLVKSGVRIAELVPMIPSVWGYPQAGAATRLGGADVHSAAATTVETETEVTTATVTDANAGDEKYSTAAIFNTAARQRSAGAALTGGNAVLGSELDKYLRTKVQRMGHMLSLPPHSA